MFVRELGTLTVRDRLEAGFEILEMIRLRRWREADPGLATAIESAIIDRELRELEGDLWRDLGRAAVPSSGGLDS